MATQAETDQTTSMEFFAGDGEMTALMRAHDWANSLLGPTSTWSQSLKTTIRILLTSRFSMWMGWGPDLAFFYNDAYRRDTLGVKHPWALGRPTREVWAEIWDDLESRIEKVLQTGEATWDEGLMLLLERSGYQEETYHTFSYSPLADDIDRVAGMLCVVTEETERIIGERRLALLREVTAALIPTRTVEDVCTVIPPCIANNARDLPFALIYLFEDDGQRARLVCTSGVSEADPFAVPIIGKEVSDTPWPLESLRASPQPIIVANLSDWFADLPCGPWSKPPVQAVAIPLAQQGQERPAGFLIAGVNPYRVLDAAYQGFLSLLAGQIAASLANARAYEEERRRAEALAELDRAKTVFFSNVSHEFRTPLTLMLGPVEDILAKPEDEVYPENRELLALVQRNGQRLLKLVNTLLDFTRIEAGRMQAHYEPTDLAAFTAELASVFRSAMDKAGIRLVVHCSPLSEPVCIDRDMWEKIVLNLLSNAFKFTWEGEISVTLREEDGKAILAVQDTGTGISEAQLPHIFERFHRVEGERARTHEGTGIGLALVLELVRLHGGAIGVESVYGEGTTFQVSLPLGTAHLSPERITAPTTLASTALRADAFVEEALRWLPNEENFTLPAGASESNLNPQPNSGLVPVALPHRARILLADDNADMREYVRRLLRSEYDVTAVADGTEALKVAQATPPDLVLSDIMMSNLDGFGLLAALRNDPHTASVPVILLSARAGEEARIEGLAAGADDYLTKPFAARELLARVASHLELARIRREAEQAIRESEERFRTLADNIAQQTWMADSEKGIYWFNQRWFDFSGRTQEELQGWGWATLLHPDDAARLVERLAYCLQTGAFWEETFPLRRKDGQYRWFLSRAVPIRDATGQIVRWFGTNTDITEERQLQQELQNERARLTEVFQQAPAFIAVMRGAEHRFEMVNPPYYQLVGHRDLLGKPAREAFPEIEGQGFFEILDEVYRTGKPFVGKEMRILFRENFGDSLREHFIDFVYQPLVEADGSVSGIVAHGIDVTERRQAEEQRQQQQRKIEEMNVRLQRAMTETHHRVKNNLQLVSALIDIQRGDGEEMVPASELARLSANVRAMGVIHDILTQEAKAGNDQESLSARDVLHRLIQVLDQTSGDRKLQSTIDDARLSGKQATSLALVTNELTSNALKHGKGDVGIAFRVQGNRAVLEVCDDGPGFAEGFDAGTAANTGLELVENVVRWDLHGEIEYNNRSGGGAQISVIFPLASDVNATG